MALGHPPYSPDLSPWDYHLFGPLKQMLGGQRFDDDTGVEEFVHKWLQTRTSSFFEEGIKKIASSLKKCVSKSGDSVENDIIILCFFLIESIKLNYGIYFIHSCVCLLYTSRCV